MDIENKLTGLKSTDEVVGTFEKIEETTKPTVSFTDVQPTDWYAEAVTYAVENGLHHGHAPCVCQNCERYFLTRSGHKPKYCSGMAPQDGRLTCRQYGAMMHQKEQNKQHPVYRIFSTRTNTIRKHHHRGKISDELREEALRLAETYRDKALLDNGYAADGYVHDMEQETLYAQARARLAQGEKP